MKDLKKFATDIVKNFLKNNTNEVKDKDDTIKKIVQCLEQVPIHIENLLKGNFDEVFDYRDTGNQYRHKLCDCLKTNFRNPIYNCGFFPACNIIYIKNEKVLHPALVLHSALFYNEFRSYCQEVVLRLKQKEFMKPYGVAWELMSVVWHPKNIDKFKYLDVDTFG